MLKLVLMPKFSAMKRIAFLLLFLSATSLIAFNNNKNMSLFGLLKPQTQTYTSPKENYAVSWKEIEKYKKEGKPKSALKIAEDIYAKAKKANNAPQQIKAALHILKFREQFEEDAMQKGIKWLEEETDKAAFPAKPIMQSILASYYWSYYEEERYEILDRSRISGEEKELSIDEIESWDADMFSRKVSQLYLASLMPTEILQQVPVREFVEILINEKESPKYRPTLYDLLAHRAVDFFRNTESGVTKPTEEWKLNDKSGLLPADEFVKIEFKPKDSNAVELELLALQIYQSLIKFHLKDKTPDALVDADLNRLKFAKEITFTEEKNDVFYNSLLQLEKKFLKDSISAEVAYERALFIHEGYRPDKKDTSFSLKKLALNICEETIKKFPKSRGAHNCNSLKALILAKELNLEIEEVVLPDAPFKTLINYRNIKKVYYKIVKDDASLQTKLEYEYYREEWIKETLNKNALKSGSFDLSLPDDHEKHSVEVSFEKLPVGNYNIFLSNNEDFSFVNNSISYTPFQISGIKIIEQSNNITGSHNFYVIEGKNGQGIEGANIELYAKVYNNKTQTSGPSLFFKLTSEKDGFFTLKGDANNLILKVIYKNDSLISDSRINLYQNFYDSQKQTKSFLFTDRAIYRPGQTVYFKGIILENQPDNNENQIIKNNSTTVQFFDVNGQKISDLQVKTNEYGSYSGSFVIPSGLLNGSMRIEDQHGSVYFQVEEYKRPKFEVKILPVKGTYKLNETVKIEGEAMSYSGVAISKAQLKFRVVRNAHFPIWWMWWKPMPSVPEKEIINGVLTTDEKGHFNISFKTEPDESLSPELKPEFSYTIYADVTDISGETQGTETSINAGYVALRAQIQMPEWVSKNEALNYEIELKNLNGQPVKQDGNLKIEKLKEPAQLFRQKLWEKPDQHIIPEEKYRKLFPHDAYKNEDEIQNFPVEKEYFNLTVSSNNKHSVKDAKPNDLPEGQYKITYSTTDSFGQKVENVKFFKIYNEKSKRPAINNFAYLIPVKTQNLEPGNNAKFIFGSAANTTVYLKIEHLGKIISEKVFTVKNEQEEIEIPVKEEYRGGIFMHLFMVNENRLYKFQEKISVPFTNKELQVQTVSFRSKLKPGEAESWKLLIKGKNGEKVASEVIAGMYDASLDAFVPHNWNFSIYNENNPALRTNDLAGFNLKDGYNFSLSWNTYSDFFERRYDQLNSFGLNLASGYIEVYYQADPLNRDGFSLSERVRSKDLVGNVKYKSELKSASWREVEQEANTSAGIFNPQSQQKPKEQAPKPRKNLQETAFFYPQLRTNENGEVSIEFKTPEALTRWNFMVLAHTQDLKIGQFRETVVTQKELMVQPNPPRFLREGDKNSFSAKVSNVSGEAVNGEVYLKLIDPITGKDISAEYGLKNKETKQELTLEKAENKAFYWEIQVPEGMEQLQFQVMAETKKFADGEEGVIPILPKRMMITESLPLPIRGNQTKEFNFEKLLNSGKSSTLKPYNLTLEMTSNPAWYAVLALPYIMEYPYDCAEQAFNRYYGNSLAHHILVSKPKIKQILDAWRLLDSKAFVSNLEKNQDLKNILLEESPWVREAKEETERRRRMVQLFEVNQLESSLAGTLTKLEQMQMPEGAWPWFSGMYPDRYITQYIVSGFGHLDKLDVKPEHKNRIRPMLENAIKWMDEQAQKDYKYLLQHKANMDENHLSPIHISYLYSRSFYLDIPLQDEHKKAFAYWKEQAQKYWLKTSLINHAMLATALQRLNDKSTPANILASLTERSLTTEEMGMYWKENNNGYFWYEHPIETQSLLIEAYEEIAKDEKKVEEMKIWLLKQKQTQNWKSTKATADACYALLLRGENLLASDKIVQVYLGGENVLKQQDQSIEKGTGYYRANFQGKEIKPEMGKVKVVKEDAGIAWGALHWQYYEDLDKITPHQSPLSIKKQVFIEENTSRGPVVKAVTDKNTIKVGDKLKIRIELKVDRNMEYVHLKDMRAAALEPLDALSGYGYKGGLGYYQSIKDASMNFFFAVLPRGSYVFEYDLRASQAGEFMNGIAQVQCMYAPEFGAHSEGVKIIIKI